jgi:hypothetical protein
MDATYSFRWESYCCFCLFQFNGGDKLIRPLHPSELSTDGTFPTSKTVLFEYKTPVFDPEDKRCIPPRKWRWYREVIPAAHLSCHQDWPLVYLKRLWGLVCYQSQPPPCDEARRISVLAKEAASQTKPALQEQARINIKALLSSQPVPQSIQDGRNGLVSFVVNASKPIWGTDVVFEGIRYVNCLSNEQDGKDFRPVAIQREGILDAIYFASNHLGVVAIFFVETILSKQERPGIWWSCLTASKKDYLLKGYSDVNETLPKAPVLDLTWPGLQDS